MEDLEADVGAVVRVQLEACVRLPVFCPTAVDPDAAVIQLRPFGQVHGNGPGGAGQGDDQLHGGGNAQDHGIGVYQLRQQDARRCADGLVFDGDAALDGDGPVVLPQGLGAVVIGCADAVAQGEAVDPALEGLVTVDAHLAAQEAVQAAIGGQAAGRIQLHGTAGDGEAAAIGAHDADAVVRIPGGEIQPAAQHGHIGVGIQIQSGLLGIQLQLRAAEDQLVIHPDGLGQITGGGQGAAGEDAPAGMVDGHGGSRIALLPADQLVGVGDGHRAAGLKPLGTGGHLDADPVIQLRLHDDLTAGLEPVGIVGADGGPGGIIGADDQLAVLHVQASALAGALPVAVDIEGEDAHTAVGMIHLHPGTGSQDQIGAGLDDHGVHGPLRLQAEVPDAQVRIGDAGGGQVEAVGGFVVVDLDLPAVEGQAGGIDGAAVDGHIAGEVHAAVTFHICHKVLQDHIAVEFQSGPLPAVDVGEIVVGTEVLQVQFDIPDGHQTVFIARLAALLAPGPGHGIVGLEGDVFGGHGQRAAAVDGHIVAVADVQGRDIVAPGVDGVLPQHPDVEGDRAPAVQLDAEEVRAL